MIARDYVRSNGLEPAPVNARNIADVDGEHVKDSEIVKLKASLGAIHFMCLHYPGGVDLSVLASECEDATTPRRLMAWLRPARYGFARGPAASRSSSWVQLIDGAWAPYFSMPSSSTSKTSVAFGGIAAPAPWSP